MNRFFELTESDGKIPGRAFARLDDIEPIDRASAQALTFVFDAVDADWPGFAAGGAMDLRSDEAVGAATRLWSRRFGREMGDDDPMDKVPIYRIEFELPRTHPWFPEIVQDEEPWVLLRLTREVTDVEVHIYSGLFVPPTRAYLEAPPSEDAPQDALTAQFDMKTWPKATDGQVEAALSGQGCPDIETLVCFDIGQGSASALLCSAGHPVYYFDVGKGSGRNGPTAPPTVDFCTCYDPVVVLSHWDTDHWAGAAKHAGLHARTWVVPHQTISTTHTALGANILKAGGTILVMGVGAGPIQWTVGNQSLDLQRCAGPSGRNNTGLALVVEDGITGASWVLTGDAAYNYIPQGQKQDVVALVAPHHGADMGAASIPFAPTSGSYRRLFYSFGPNNKHGPKSPFVQHPVPAAISAHKQWSHGAWATPPGGCLAGGDVLATATHPATHLDGAAATFAGTPPNLGHLGACANAMPVPQW